MRNSYQIQTKIKIFFGTKILLLKTFALSFLLIFSKNGYSQIVDNFSDGDLISNPVWIGDTAQFQINAEGRLQSFGNSISGVGSIQISTQSAISNACFWEFYVNPQSTSSLNFTDVFLMSNKKKLDTNNIGYFLRIGGAEDNIKLFRKDGLGNNSELFSSPQLTNSNSGNPLKIRIERDLSGKWKIFTRKVNSTSCTFQGEIIDNTYNTSGFFGVFVSYTNAFSDKFLFDDFVIKNVPIENIQSCGSFKSPSGLVITNSGMYEQYVPNSFGCDSIVKFSLTILPTPNITGILGSTICIGGNSGSFNISATGGTPPIAFLWANGTNGPIIEGLVAGNYRVIATDTKGCKDTSIAIVSTNNLQAPSLNLSTVKVCNGTSPSIYNLLDNSSYTYQWSTGSTANSINVSTPGSYIVTATAPNSCIKRDTTFAENYPNCGGFLELESDPIVNYFDTINVRVKIKGGVNVFSTFANLTFDLNRMKLISNKVGNFLGNNIISTPPIVTGNTIDFGMTKTTGQPGSNGDGDVYTFRFVLTNLPDTNSVKFNTANPNSFNANFGLSNVQVYNAQGLQPPSFVAVSPTILPRPIRYYVPVWPGDLNNDKIVNVVDILPIGYFYNTQGPQRPNGSFSWTGQPARLWGLDKSEVNKDAYRTFADGNADGKITLSDQAPIGFNLGQTHARRAVDQLEIPNIEEITAIPTLRVDIPNTPIPLATLPQNLQVDIFIGSSSDPVSNLYGIAFDLFFTPGVLNVSGIIPNYDGSIFGTLGTDFTKIEDPTQISSGKYSIGMTRFNTNAVTASGQKLLSLSFPISSGIQDVNLKFVARPLSCNNPSGNPITIQGSRDSVNLGNPVSVIKDTKKGNRIIKIYPNPGSQIINFKSDLSINEIDFIDAFGKEVLVIRNPGSPFSISDLPNGFYFIRLISTNGVETTKFVKE
jgi:hypothetical protein